MRQQLLSGAGRPFAPRYLRLAVVSLLLIALAVPEVRGPLASERVGHEASIVGPPVSSALGSTDDSPGLHERTFWSNALGREMPYSVYLPPGYDPTSPRRYPVLYMLHGLGGNHLEEWTGYGLIDTATALIAGELPPMIIVLPEGEDGYWSTTSTEARPGARTSRATSWQRSAGASRPSPRRVPRDRRQSMGAHGAIQLAMNFPASLAS
ncbi:MAG: alpha/beta hydrolase-fold protein [Dehalococcoidia bacterium]